MPIRIEPKPSPPQRSFLAGFLSYLVPGLGQIYQGRIAKGLLFLVCLYGLFLYGMALGSWKNVYLPDTAKENNPWKLPLPVANLYNRLQFVGQFWIGAAAWPAIYQYATYDRNQEPATELGKFMRTPADEEDINKLQRDGDKSWDLGWVYTVIAGVLNVLVMYDAYAGAAFAEGELAQSAGREAKKEVAAA